MDKLYLDDYTYNTQRDTMLVLEDAEEYLIKYNNENGKTFKLIFRVKQKHIGFFNFKGFKIGR